MHKFFLFFLPLLFPLAAFAQNERSVEVTGIATRKILADRYTLHVEVIAGEPCAIPAGKNYQKYVQECKETNKQLMASRENILKGIIDSYGPLITLTDRTEVEYRNSLEFDLLFTKISDINDFKKKLEEYKKAFKTGELKAYYSKMNSDLYQEVKMESLLDAKKKAETMASTLNVALGQVLNIYESKPGNMGGWMDFIGAMMVTEGGGRKARPESLFFGLSEIPDEDGYLVCTATSYVRFALK